MIDERPSTRNRRACVRHTCEDVDLAHARSSPCSAPAARLSQGTNVPSALNLDLTIDYRILLGIDEDFELTVSSRFL
jgi:hypothetical protein